MAQLTPFIRWAGGKTWLIPVVKELISGLEYNTFFEPFMGSASVFFAIEPVHESVLSDVNQELVDTFCAVKEKPQMVVSYMKRLTNDEESYYAVRESEPKGKYKKAGRFLYLNTYSFNGLYRVNREGKYNVPYGHRKIVYDYDKLIAASEKLQHAEILCQDFDAIRPRIHENDLVFLDPPYAVSREENCFLKYNSTLFSLDDQYRLAELIDYIIEQGAYFILSNAAHPTIQDLFGERGRTITCERNSLIGGKKAYRGKIQELVFTNIPERMTQEE